MTGNAAGSDSAKDRARKHRAPVFMMILSSIGLLVFPALMAFAASSDLLTMRIANWLVLLIAAAFFAAALLVGLPLNTLVASTGLAVGVLAMGFAFFALGWIGGGDAKLAAVTALWVGLPAVLPYLVYAALLGGALTLGILALRRWPLPDRLMQVRWIGRLHSAKSGVPYGIALALAGILVYSRTDIFALLTQIR